MNGVAALSDWDAKTAAFINLVTGSLLVIGNFIGLFRAEVLPDYTNAAGGFLFGVTYLFIAANYLLKLDVRAFGWYSLWVALFAVIGAFVSVRASAVPLGILWGAWAVLWGLGFLQLGLRIKPLAKVFPYVSILEGIFAAGVPGVFMLFGWW
jgi:acid-activated urea channel